MKNELEQNNTARVIGRVVNEPVKSHEIEGERFYELILEVKRLSETFDYIPVTISERTLEGKKPVSQGDIIGVFGEFRSYNRLENEKSKLILHVFAKEVFKEDEFDKLDDLNNTNSVVITGFVCKEPIFRVTPFKREICDALIAVNRRNYKSDYLPCIFWGRNARFMDRQPIGKKLNIEGRIQSRNYVKKYSDGTEEEKTAYEISVSKLREVDLDDSADSYKTEAYKNYIKTNAYDNEDVMSK